MFNVQNNSKMFYPKSKRSLRWDAVKSAMAKWRDSREEPKAYNYSLKGYITVSSRISTRETPYHASRTPESTEAVCSHFNEILRFAVKKEEVEPHSNFGSKFKKLIILERRLTGGVTAKLTVGVTANDNLVQYCITATA